MIVKLIMFLVTLANFIMLFLIKIIKFDLKGFHVEYFESLHKSGALQEKHKSTVFEMERVI